MEQPCGGSSSGVTSEDSIHKERPNMDSESLRCVHKQTPRVLPDYSHASNYAPLLPASSGSRYQHNGYPPYASNMKSSRGHLLETAALKTNAKREKLYLCNDAKLTSRGFKSENMQNPTPFESPGSAQKVGCQFENANESHSEVGDISIGFSPEVESSNVPESSSISSALDEISLEAASFHQLQQVLDQVLESFEMLKFDHVFFIRVSWSLGL